MCVCVCGLGAGELVSTVNLALSLYALLATLGGGGVSEASGGRSWLVMALNSVVSSGRSWLVMALNSVVSSGT